MVEMRGGLPFDAATVARVNVEGCGFKLQHPARAVLCFTHGVNSPKGARQGAGLGGFT